MASSPLDEACDQLDQLGGWRAYFLISADASEVQAVLDTFPWVVEGQVRPRTMVRIFKRDEGLVVITGGILSEAEGAVLFDVRDALEEVLSSAFIIPPKNAPPPLIERMWASGCTTELSNEPLPNVRGMVLATIFALGFTGFLNRLGRHAISALPRVILLVLGLAISVGFGVAAWITYGRSISIEAHPTRIVAGRWVTYAPPRPLRR